MDRVNALRSKLHSYHINEKTDTYKLKDILFLDLGLEQYTKTLADRIVHIDIGFEAFIREI